MEKEQLKKLREELEQLDEHMLEHEQRFSDLRGEVHPINLKAAENLLHYLALRSMDIRSLQDRLHAAGLSSLASSESHIRGQLAAILERMGSRKKAGNNIISYEAGKSALELRAGKLFGQRSSSQLPGIMATFNTGIADDYPAVKSMLQSGMTIARINCAHDNEAVWFRMIQQVKRASRITGLPCKIYMDLAGPKIRTVLAGREKLKVQEGQLIYLADEAHLKKSSRNTVGCTVKGIAKMLQVGEKVLFDDGLIEARVERVAGTRVALIIMRISARKPFIRQEKGINFPESMLQLPALTHHDRKCLPFIQKHADLVGFSFVRTPNDLRELRSLIASGRKLPVIIKIETPEAVRNFPALLLEGLREEEVGVMIARGDLAVEIGFERMSEIQEEILWISEAAHVPVIWATQVLENLNKSGVATRSEITDAAHAALADCVMVNKGQHVIRVIETLRDIFLRSGGHHVKKRYTFRPLAIARGFTEP